MTSRSDARGLPGADIETVLRRLPEDGPSRLSAQASMLYRALAREGAVPLERFEQVVGISVDGCDPLRELEALHLVRRSDFGLVAVPRREAMTALVAEQAQLLRQALEAVMDRQHRIAVLAAADSLEYGTSVPVHTTTLEGESSDSAFLAATAPARTELMALHPGGQFPQDVLDASLERARACTRAGVRLRVIHQGSALSHPASVDYLVALEGLGASVRLRDTLPFRMLLVDRETAVCSSPTGQSEQETYLLRGRRVTMLLDRVFESTWVEATPLRAGLGEPATREPDERPSPVGAVDLTAQQLTILRHLAEGETDQAIARHLGITPRTVTRRVSEIYEVLGVDSRFQAGAMASRLGLL